VSLHALGRKHVQPDRLANNLLNLRASKRIDKNPLQRITPHEAIKEARNFYQESNLQNVVDESVLVKGALYIRDPKRSMGMAKVRTKTNDSLVGGPQKPGSYRVHHTTRSKRPS
jgi:hypothetical protein